MKINLDTKLVNLKGEPYQEFGEDLTVGKVVANCLDMGDKVGGRMKLFILAKKCYDGGVADFDEVDLGLLRSAVEMSNIASNVVIGQTLAILSKEAVKEK